MEEGQIQVSSSVEAFEELRKSISISSKSDLESGGEAKQTGELKLVSIDPHSENFDLQAFFEDSIRTEEGKTKQKKLGVIFKKLTVIGQGADATAISDNLSIFKFLWPGNWFRSKGTPFEILHDVTGFCKDGEMLLVLGRPGSGCSSLLRAIANQRNNFLDVNGDVSYGGISAKEFKKFNGEAIYIPEEDLHFPTLTVEQTLDFALRLKTPGRGFTGESRSKVRHQVKEVLLKMFGLQKVRDTLVGNELIRGISGGEKKRLTIAEAMISQGVVDCWDCSTRGLDAASALDYAKCLRIITDVLHKTTTSESIYDLFDKVLVLEKGRCIYFGSAKEAKNYFLNLGFICENRKSTPDFLTGVCNPLERLVKSGMEGKVPETSFAFEEVWQKSPQYKKSLEDIQTYEEEVKEFNPSSEFHQVYHSIRTGRKNSKYVVGVFSQIIALIIRQAYILKGNIQMLASTIMSAAVLAIIFGSVFFKMELTADGGFTRGGALFSAVLFSGMVAQAELPNEFYGREVTAKHRAYGYYRIGLAHISKVVLDIPFVTFQTLVFSSIAYWMYGLDNSAEKFFIFWGILLAVSLAFTEVIRVCGVFTKTLFLGQQVLLVCFLIVIIYSGYFIPYTKMRNWLVWIYWINPIAYGFKSLFENEMRGLYFDCSTSGAIPAGPTYNDSAYKACFLPGSSPGNPLVSGDTYLKAGYAMDTAELGLNCLAIIGIWLIVMTINAIGRELIDPSKGGFVKKVFKGGKAPKIMNAEDEAKQNKLVQDAQENISSVLTLSGGMFSWSNLKYTVKVKGGSRVLLNNVEGWIRPGQMTALMGASGAGKTTLLDVLAQRKTQGKVEGIMQLNSLPLRKDFERITGYVEQMDVHEPYFTVREALRFSAKLRQDPSIPISEKYDYVERVLEMMEMSHLGDALIGSIEKGIGISVEERKRLTIGMELVAKPHILFLDEPTSGLDAQSAYNIIKFIRKLADAGMPLVCTIHQPSSVLFEFFDRLLLLAAGGNTAYFGDIGKDSKTIDEYFARNGARKLLPTENPAEYILEVIGAGVGAKQSPIDWNKAWAESKERQIIHDELHKLEEEAKSKPKPTDVPKEFATSQFYQAWELYKRLNLVWWRNPQYNVSRVIQSLAVGIVLGVTFYDIGNSTSDLNLRILASFVFLVLSFQLILAALPVFMIQRDLFRRDYSSKFYSWAPFTVVMLFVDIPYLIFDATVCVEIAFWLIGLNTTPANNFYFWAHFNVFLFFSISLGQVVAALSPNLGIANILLPVSVNFLLTFAGVVAPPMTLGSFWRNTVYRINPMRYFLEGLLTSVLHTFQVVCKPEDFLTFPPFPGMTCGEYLTPFLQMGPSGYLANPESTDLCKYCAYSNGEEWYKVYDWSYSRRWINFGYLIGFWAFNIVISAFFIYAFRKPRR